MIRYYVIENGSGRVEQRRTARAVAEQDVSIFFWLGKRTHIEEVEESSRREQ